MDFLKNIKNVKKDIARQLGELAGFIIYQRGFDYFKSGAIQKISILVSEESSETVVVSGEVEGHDIYVGEFYFNLETNKILAVECDCPYNGFCKHTVALALNFAKIYYKFLETHQEINFIDTNFQRNYFVKWFQKNKDLDFSYQTKDTVGNIENNLEKEKKGREELGKKDFTERFSIIIKSNFKFEIVLKENFGNVYDTSYALKRLLINEDKFLNQTQKKLIKYLIDYDFWNETDQKLEILINLIQESQLKTELEFDYSKNQVKISAAPQNKIKLTLLPETEEITSSLRTMPLKNEIISAQIKANFFGDKKEIIFGSDGLLVITPKKITFHKMSPLILNLFQEFQTHFDYLTKKQFIKINLSNNFIFNLNDFLRDAQKYLELETDLEANFKIEKFSKTRKVIIVDYDNTNAVMKVTPGIDYLFETVLLPEVFSKNRIRGRDNWQEKSFGPISKKYIVKINFTEKSISYALRKINIEKKFYEKIIKNYLQFEFTKTGRTKKTGYHAIFKYYDDIFPKFEQANYQIKFLRDKLEFESEDFRANFQVDFNAENDWLAFDVDTYCGKDKITLESLQNFIKQKDSFLRTESGKLINIKNHQELEKFVLMLESFYLQTGSSNKFTGKIYHAAELENVFTSSKYYQAQTNQAFSKFMNEAKSGKPVQKVKLTTQSEKVLRDYQKEGIDWFYFLRQYRFGGILADDMGLGKTLEALTLLEMNQKKNQPSIVICPKTLLYNWKNEAQKFTPKLKVMVIDGSPEERQKNIKKLSCKGNPCSVKNQVDVIITSYHLMQRDLPEYQKNKIKFNYCILDEAQMIKNYQTKNARTVKQIDANYRLVLTGTPLENSVSEIWSMFDFLMPGFLSSYQNFSQKFLHPIMKRNNLDILNDLKKKIAPFMLRRTKKDVLKELPPKIENIHRCKLTASQNILYQEILANVKREIFSTVEQEGFAKSQIHIFTALTKLRQVCNHPILLLKNKKYEDYEAAKLEAFNLLIDEMMSANKKVLIFSQFTTMLEILAEELEKKKIKYSYLTGQTKNRQEEIDEFNNNPERKVFLISLKAGGVGLNLTAADNVIIFDPWWNPSVENQAIDRTHRIGQKKSVNVYRLITTGTIEEKILELQKRKKYLFDSLVGESKDLFQKITWEDIQSLFE